METTLPATARQDDRGKTGARKLRQAGRLPAVVYGGGNAATSIEVDPVALSEIFRKSQNRNTIVYLAMGGENLPCIVREVQRHPVTRQLIHVDFIRVEKDRPVLVEVPLLATGKSKGLALGGRTQVVRRSLNIRAAYDKIPTHLEGDVSELDIGDSLRVSQIKTPDGVSIVYEADYPVITIAGKQKERAEEAPAAAEGAAAEGEEKKSE